ncbi:MAG: GNAT family N-acetyltransferase [Desulfobacterales bacterium]|nr:MAG: GNAT family N-acetyltransferase [Desulfobacterales bacterium]
MEIETTTTFLEMLSRKDFKPKILNRDDVWVKKVEIPTPVINHFFFVNVGRPWKWYSRLKWTLAEWKALVEKETVTTWIGYIKGSPFGYIELVRQLESVEIAFFGLLPQYIGMGLGGFLLSEAIRLAWELNPQRVWVHTCTLDHKYALDNYLARGLIICKKEKKIEQIPDDDDPIWTTPQFYASLTEEYSALSKDIAG